MDEQTDRAESTPVDDESRVATESTEENDALLSRLRLIEDQPLESRAAAFTQVHDELRSALEGGDSPGHHG